MYLLLTGVEKKLEMHRTLLIQHRGVPYYCPPYSNTDTPALFFHCDPCSLMEPSMAPHCLQIPILAGLHSPLQPGLNPYPLTLPFICRLPAHQDTYHTPPLHPVFAFCRRFIPLRHIPTTVGPRPTTQSQDFQWTLRSQDWAILSPALYKFPHPNPQHSVWPGFEFFPQLASSQVLSNTVVHLASQFLNL